jgi:hypothetical protein
MLPAPAASALSGRVAWAAVKSSLPFNIGRRIHGRPSRIPGAAFPSRWRPTFRFLGCYSKRQADWDGSAERRLTVMARAGRIGVKTRPPIASTSWLGSSGPPVAARACGDGPDKPGHDGVATIVPRARYLNAHAAQAGHPRLASVDLGAVGHDLDGLPARCVNTLDFSTPSRDI